MGATEKEVITDRGNIVSQTRNIAKLFMNPFKQPSLNSGHHRNDNNSLPTCDIPNPLWLKNSNDFQTYEAIEQSSAHSSSKNVQTIRTDVLGRNQHLNQLQLKFDKIKF